MVAGVEPAVERVHFVAEAVKALEQFDKNPDEINDLLTRQVAYVNAECTWPRRADDWEHWLAEKP